MKRMVAMVVLLALTVLAGSEAIAQRGIKGRSSKGWGPGSAYGRMYDPKTVVTIQGEVVSVDTFMSKGMSPGVHVTLKTSEETLSVHLGPEWYISGLDMKFVPGDIIEVMGSRITFEGKPAIIAIQVTKDSEVLRLRDEDGFPAWGGRSRRK
jgi:hypothetical protein